MLRDERGFIEGPINCIERFEQSCNWKKKIFWDLPYLKDDLLCHNIDVMHIFFLKKYSTTSFNLLWMSN